MRYRFTIETLNPLTDKGKLLKLALQMCHMSDDSVLEDLIVESTSNLTLPSDIRNYVKKLDGFIRLCSWDKLDSETREPDIYYYPVEKNE